MAGRSFGTNRSGSSEFTFLVGIPTMFAASAYDVFKNRDDLKHLGSQLIIDTTIGFLVSMVVAFFVVKWLLRFVQSHTFNGFAVYRVVLGGGLLIGLYTHSIPDIGADELKAKALNKEQAPVVAPVIPAPDTTTNTVTPTLITNAEVTPVVPAVTPAPPADTNTVVTPAVTPASATNEPVAPRALPVNPADLTNEAPTPSTPPPPANVPAH